MKLVTNYLTKNDCYKSGRKITVKGLMLHSVGCPQPKASAFMNQWNRPGKEVCVHGFIQPDGVVYQTLPWNHRGWHCASGAKGSGNNSHIGVEMTEPATIKYTNGDSFIDNDPAQTEAHVRATYATAVELFASLCEEFGLDPLADGVIISHREGHARGIASNHGDPEHLWNKFGLTMDGFRAAVKAAVGGDASGSTPTPEAPGKGGSEAYLVRVTASALHIRKGPGTNYATVGQIKDKGVYTIVEEQPGTGASRWGRLKSGAGWIALDYTKKL